MLTPVRFAIDNPPAADTLIIEVVEESKVALARDILSGREEYRVRVGGRIIRARAPYNPQWSFHLAPESILFYQSSVDLFDAPLRRIEEELSAVGGTFLPGFMWAPRGSRLLRELP